MNETPGAAGPLVQLAPFALILVVFYFLLIRPQQKKARETQEMLDSLKVNDQVVTSGGIYGRVVKLGDKEVGLEIAPKVQIRLQRSSVGQVLRPARGGESKGTEEKST
jgi:preprotein translocase subunit YajC